MPELQLARTIRTARRDEVPQDQGMPDNLKHREKANIVEGYTLRINTSQDVAFKFFSEININNSQLWNLFKAFMIRMPEQVYFIHGHHEAETLSYSAYRDKFEILNIISPFELELTQDSYLKFGIASHDKDYFEEVFVTPAKYIQYWGVNQDAFEQLMDLFSIGRKDDLEFIDQFPLVTESLQKHDPGTTPTNDLLLFFERTFAHLV